MKTTIITGASRGIGLATAKKFLDEGWRVIGTHNKTSIPIKSPNLISLELDLSLSESIIETTEKIKSLDIAIDVLINNAGVALDVHDAYADPDKIRQTFEVNLFGLIDLTEKLLPVINEGGHIVNIDSRYGSFSMPIDDETSIGYRMSKAAVNMYTRSLAFRLASRKIIVSSLHPGWVRTDMGFAGVTDDGKEPDREPQTVADEIYDVTQNVTESGQFWHRGEKCEW